MADTEDSDSTFQRKIYFFRVAEAERMLPLLPGAMQKIENLPFSDSGRYQHDPASGSYLLGFPDSLEFPLRFRFGRTRRNNLPEIERRGKLEALELAEDAGLIDVFHLVVFSDGYVAAEFNFAAPRIAKLGHYLFDKGSGLAEPPVFLPLFERDIVEVVEELDSVSLFRLTVPPSAAALIQEADENLYTAITGSAKAGGHKSVELKLRSERGEEKLHLLAKKIARLITRYPEERERLIAAEIGGAKDGRNLERVINLLEDKLVTTSVFERISPRSKSIKSDDAYEVLEREYRKFLPFLAEAVTSR